MTFTGPQRLVLLVGTLLCAALLFLAYFDLRPLTGWRLPLVTAGCFIGMVLIAVDLWAEGGAK